MCVAIALKPGARITHAEWDKCWNANPDGAGYGYIRRGHIHVERGLSRGDMWRRYFKDASNNAKSPFVVHFRIATHGSVCLDNVHPFTVAHPYKGETVIAHNGIIPGVVPNLLPDESDTRGFARMFLEALPAGWMDNVAIWELMEDYLGDSKLVILTTDHAAKEHLYIANEGLGLWIGDRWFSNDYWKWDTVLLNRGTVTYDYRSPYTHGSFKVSEYGRPVVKGCSAPGSVRSLSSLRPAPGVIDSRGVSHVPYLPNGTRPLDGMTEDALTDMMVDAIDLGFCERCMWKPCWCEGVCFDCLRPLDDCDCGTSLSCSAYYGATGAEETGECWLDTMTLIGGSSRHTYPIREVARMDDIDLLIADDDGDDAEIGGEG